MIKLHIHDLYTEKLGRQFLPAKYPKKHPQKSDISGKDTIDDLHFYLKIHSHRRAPYTSLVIKQPPGFSTNRVLEWVKRVNVTYTRIVI